MKGIIEKVYKTKKGIVYIHCANCEKLLITLKSGENFKAKPPIMCCGEKRI